MSVTIAAETGAQPTAFPPRKRWTRHDYDLAERAGVFDGQWYELVEGELVDRMGANPPHSGFLFLLSGWLSDVFGSHRVRNQLPIQVRPEDNPINLPQPDLCITSMPPREAIQRDPLPAEILLLVEVADSTFSFDTTVKAGLYARAGIADYWVLDVARRRILVHRSPSAGRYQSVTVHSATDPVAPLADPSARLILSDLAG